MESDQRLPPHQDLALALLLSDGHLGDRQTLEEARDLGSGAM